MSTLDEPPQVIMINGWGYQLQRDSIDKQQVKEVIEKHCKGYPEIWMDSPEELCNRILKELGL